MVRRKIIGKQKANNGITQSNYNFHHKWSHPITIYISTLATVTRYSSFQINIFYEIIIQIHLGLQIGLIVLLQLISENILIQYLSCYLKL